MASNMDGVGRRDPTAVFNRMVEMGDSWADHDAAANLLEETKKTRLAQLTLEVAARGEVKSRVSAEMVALASPAYLEHVKAMVDARKEANRAQVRFKSAQAWLEFVRTLEATKRAEMTLGGRQ